MIMLLYYHNNDNLFNVLKHYSIIRENLPYIRYFSKFFQSHPHPVRLLFQRVSFARIYIIFTVIKMSYFVYKELLTIHHDHFHIDGVMR